MQMNANQLTKIPVEKLSDTLQFLIAENEIPLSDALKQVIDDVDAVCKKLLRDESAPAQPVIQRELHSFVTDADIAALHRFAECCDDPESGGHDLEKEQVQRLEKVGALQRSGRISYITDFGDYLISATAPINAQPVIPEQASILGYFSFDPEDGAEILKDRQTAIDNCNASIDLYRESMQEEYPDGWSDDVKRVCWGVILQEARGFDAQGIPENDPNHTYQTLDYRLAPDLTTAVTTQPESEIPFGDVEPIEVTDDMVYAFHNRLSDGSLTSDEFTDIKQGLCAALMNIPLPTQPVITEQRQMVPDERPADSSNGNDAEAWFDEGWNACRAEMLKAQPVSEPYKFPDNLDFDCEFENGDYDIDEEPWLRGRVDGFNEALQIIKRSLNAKQNSTAQESE